MIRVRRDGAEGGPFPARSENEDGKGESRAGPVPGKRQNEVKDWLMFRLCSSAYGLYEAPGDSSALRASECHGGRSLEWQLRTY